MAKQHTPTAQDFCDRASFRSSPEVGIQAMLDNRIYAVNAAGPDALRITGHGVNVTITMENDKFVPEVK